MDLGVEKLIGRKDGAIGWMIFNNPERRNAVSLDMWRAIPDVLAAFEADPEVRVIVFTGAGERAFVAGADISQFEAERSDASAEQRYSSASAAATVAMSGLSKPSIAMIRGYCIGGGLAVALTCDMRICTEESRFAIPAARLGLGYGFGGVKALIDVVGPSIAKEILFTARQFSAEEALRVGLVNRVAPAGELETLVRDYAAMIGANAPLTLRAAKLAAREAMRDPERRRLAEVEAAVAACFDSADFKEGRTAFMEKRSPQFRGV
ncbi:MAG TPA: enoyl-CoA hydratase, partial [Caulobacteraceae bacterium]|jgi:enoyl-CoA hydratase/carnithine racemase|nr:enoyl-CoA hydratase [Caulobacteraceae bacterium]